MDRRQDLNVTSTPAGKSGPSAQDRYCARGGIEMVLCDGIEMVGIEMELCDLYLKRFDLTKVFVFKTFVITVCYKLCRCDMLSIGVQIIFTTNELVDRIKNLK